jgi:acetamidase/formamidase
MADSPNAPLAGGVTLRGKQRTIHTVNAERSSFVWDNSIPPIAEVESGDIVELEIADASGGQITRESDVGQLASFDLERVNPVTGPIFVKGAQPGDVLMVEILEFRPQDWGWTAIMPGFGLLSDDFPDPWLRISAVDEGEGLVRFGPDVSLPYEPFPGTIGVAPARAGRSSTRVPHEWGGNMDIKHLRAGTTLYLPVGVAGALFAAGDTHSAMGDGEVCGTAIETPMTMAVRLTVRSDLRLPRPEFTVPAGAIARTEAASYHVCTGIDGDLMTAARDATRGIVQHILDRHGQNRQDAYAIASVAVNLRIHEIVDSPNWVVGAFLPESIFGSALT